MSFHKNHSERPGLLHGGRVLAGDTPTRPAGLGQQEAGVQFYDQQIAKLVIWDGLEWVDAMGKPVDVHEAAPEAQPAETIPDAHFEESDAETPTEA